MSETIFQARNIFKKYGEEFALRNISMNIKQGEIYGLVGENGAGKTTLMNIISGLVYPTSGSIILFGDEPANLLSKARKRLGVLIEMPALYPNMSAYENLTFYCRINGIKNERLAISKVLNMVSMNEINEKKVGEFSLGMKQRLGLGVALLSEPEFLVLDEPINGLDPAGIIDIRNILEKLVRDQGATILVSSHILSELQVLATKIGVVHKGQIVDEISTEEWLKSAQQSICIKTELPNETTKILHEHLHLEQIKINEKGEIIVPNNSTDIQRIIEVLMTNNVKVDGINLVTTNLENYYMNLINNANLKQETGEY